LDHLHQLCRTFQFSYNGQTWDLPRPNARDVKYPYAKFRQEKRKAGLLSSFVIGTPEYRAAMEVYQASFDDGTYAWRGEAFRKSLRDDENVIELLWLWFQMVDKKVTREWLWQIWEEEMGKPQEERQLDNLLTEMVFEKNFSVAPTGANGQATEKSSPSSPATHLATAETKS
jgi:hypothetical protein